MNYLMTIGLEIHLKLNSETKIFCRCKNEQDFEVAANTNICPFCTGQPGTLPQLSKQVVEKSIKFGKAMNATVNEVSTFDRKNYFYPDLPAGYQITQFYHPIIQNGKVSFWINNYEEEKTVNISEAHMESDTAKMLHEGEKSLLDFNSWPLRIKEIPDKPQQAELEVGYLDALYGRSKGCITPSGWSCASLPYLLEVDNFDCSDTPGQSTIDRHYIWGYDEISWLYLQDEEYRNQWIRYAYHWIREHDPNGFLKMPGTTVTHLCEKGRPLFHANTRSEHMPNGLNMEETIKALWNN